jgi:hypothetical protein
MVTSLFFISIPSTTIGETITLFRNTLDTTEFGTKCGAILINSSKTSKTMTDEVTICFRFNFKVLAGLSQKGRGVLVYIGDRNVQANVSIFLCMDTFNWFIDCCFNISEQKKMSVLADIKYSSTKDCHLSAFLDQMQRRIWWQELNSSMTSCDKARRGGWIYWQYLSDRNGLEWKKLVLTCMTGIVSTPLLMAVRKENESGFDVL